ncbi:polysaccharide biosynthesis/export family protein [Salegentibacter salegens]|uniref:Polysaccharide export outer membrane protein n=1 Tax=Salegentibacter salegens TaxID=143223 RepID=A0A1M7HEQ5_9FLAO|nr:polysaccharide biosynthesis/export family protein [Salegentibacter salegens]PRX44103.1 polysaccharide export outer membrane protein [Salegentibacter salegens]SHM26843.1 polysaccharide export outer membrane protein [Salegentibacter salegens]
MIGKISRAFLLLSVSISVLSCATKDEVVYFDNSQSLEGKENLLDYEPKIERNDVLRINVSSSSVNQEIVAPFQMNSQGQGSGGGGGGQNLSLTGYLVSPNGTINFPVLGTLEVEGLTRTAIQEKLEEQIAEYVRDPVVDVRIVNFSVTILGEIGSPGRVQITDGRVTMPELLAMSGDITYNGKRENIKIIREVNGVKTVGYIDMTESDLFDSPFYYLKQNDLVYVEPTYRTVKSAGFFSSYQGIVSVGTTIISLYFLINSL